MGCVNSTNVKVSQISQSQLLSNKTNELSPKCSINGLQDCKHMFNLRQLLDYYHKWMLLNIEDNENKSDKIGIYEYISKNESYSVYALLHDYHHLINIHSSEFEEIYDFFGTETCNVETCHMMKRNHRDRSNNLRLGNSRNRSEIYYNHRDLKEVISQQFLDQIHCYIYHQKFFQLTKAELEEIDNEDELKLADNVFDFKKDTLQQRMSRIIQEKKKQILRVRNRTSERLRDEKHSDSALDVNVNNSKFMSNIVNENPMYSFGVRYYYDEKYKDNETLDVEFNVGYTYSYWFISVKYANLKEELLQNKMEIISKEQYNDLKLKAKYYKKTEHVLQNCKKISVDNLICVMIYCNFDTFQCQYTKTYRHELNESDGKLKERHLEFANMGKILLNAVENSGITVEKSKTKIFYHGISIELMFSSTLHRFCGPMSTSCVYTIALLFTNNKGIILELNDGTLLSHHKDAMYFDCEFISDFAYEKEKFFIGGIAPLKIVSIYNVRSDEYYGTYIKLINTLLSIVQGDLSINQTNHLVERNQGAIVKLLQYEMGTFNIPNIPIYVSKLLHNICANIEFFTTRYSKTFDNNKSNPNYDKYKILTKFLCNDDCHLFNLKILTKLFPNICSIAISCSSLTSNVFKNILQFLSEMTSENKDIKLNDFVFTLPTSGLSFKKIIKTYMTAFQKFTWTINIKNNSLVIQKHQSEKSVKTGHDRQTSVNMAQARMISANTERFIIGSTVDIFVDD